MNRRETASELAWLTGCIGLAGETRIRPIRNVVRTWGDRRLHHGCEETAAGVFKRIFGEAP